MNLLILLVLSACNLVFLLVGYRIGRGLSPIASPAQAWTNLREFVKPEPAEEPKPPEPIKQLKF